MRRLTTLVAVGAATTMFAATAASAASTASGNAANSLGKTTLDTELQAGINYGSGIPDGEWITAEIQGVEIGLRATDRTDGLLPVAGTNGNRVGVYNASTGLDTGSTNRADWNYEFHVDLSRATGAAEGRSLADYSLSLEQDFAPGLGTLELDMLTPGVCYWGGAAPTTLCQQSWNPAFFNAAAAGYDLDAEATYHLRLVLTPKTFNGPSVAVRIQVNVSNP